MVSANDVEDLPAQGDSSRHHGGKKASESKEEIATRHNIISHEMSAFIAQSGRRYHPVFDKFEPEHVSQFLKNSHERDTATRRQLSTNRNYAFAYFVVIVGIFIFLAVFLLPDNKELFVEILKAIGYVTVGGFGGYGLHGYISENRNRRP